MRIGIDISSVLKNERTGVEEYTYQLVSHMLLLPESQGHEFFLYSHGTEIEFQSIFPKRTSRVTFVIKPHRLFWHQFALLAMIKKTRPDVFFSTSNPLPLFFKRAGIPGVVTIHGMEWMNCSFAYSFWERLYLYLGVIHSVSQARGVIAVSQRTRDGLCRMFPLIGQSIRVIHHGVSRPPALYSVPERFPKNGSQWSILFIGRKDRRKNIRGIVRACDIVRRRSSTPFILTIAGPDGNDAFGRRLVSIASGHARIEHIRRFVSKEEKEHLYSQADILLLPSFDEGFGMPILEAQSMGAVPILSAFLKEIGGKGAIYCDPKEPESIADSVLALMSDQRLYWGLQRNALENSRRFSWETCARDTLQFLCDVCVGFGNKVASGDPPSRV